MKSVTIQVFGKVQGVWFRASTKSKAEELGISGEVQNLKDGSVLIEAEGKESDIKNFAKWCKRGPEFAEVKEIKIQDCPNKNFTDFKVKRN